MAHDTDMDELGDLGLDVDELPEAPTPSTTILDQYAPADERWILDESQPDGIRPPLDPDVAAPIPLTPANLCCMRQDDAPACRHYGRQLCPFGAPREETRGHRLMRRFCTHPSLRALNGAALHFNDEEGMYACSLRDPPLARLDEKLDGFDGEIMSRGTTRRAWPMFRTPEQAAAGVHTLPAEEEKADG